MSGRSNPWAVATTRHTMLFAISLFALLPFLWMVSISFKSPGEMFQTSGLLWPEHFYALENYSRALSAAPLVRFLLNGLFVCSAIVILQILICAPCAYALAKLKFTGRDTMFTLVLIALVIPPQVLTLPLFVLCYKLGILNTYSGLIVPFIVSPFGIFLLRQFFKSIPDELIHAARLDGVSEFGIVWRIMVPIAMPALIAFAIFSAVSHWNALLWPLIVVQSEPLMPPAQGIVSFRSDEAGIEYGPLMAGAVIVVAPLIVAFLVAHRRFIDGLKVGA
jgi:multiple sugar transport system permease protein